MNKHTDALFAQALGITPRAVLSMKRKTPLKYNRLRMSWICELYGITESDLLAVAKIKNPKFGLEGEQDENKECIN